MHVINANTKIATLIKQHPNALEAIITISPKFSKLRNPFLRKVMAGRTSIAMASKLAGCKADDFFKVLKPLGFIIDTTTAAVDTDNNLKTVPSFLQNIYPDSFVELDVRSIIESGKDPLNSIVQKVKTLKAGDVLKIINSFEPVPLIQLLKKQGYDSYSEFEGEDKVNTFFYKKEETELPKIIVPESSADWDKILKMYQDKLVVIDVRNLEMPLPMHTILDALAQLPVDKALFVYHKRIPVFLLPELESQQFSYRIKEIGDAEVHLLIFKN